jgi:hypothetical protein
VVVVDTQMGVETHLTVKMVGLVAAVVIFKMAELVLLDREITVVAVTMVLLIGVLEAVVLALLALLVVAEQAMAATDWPPQLLVQA